MMMESDEHLHADGDSDSDDECEINPFVEYPILLYNPDFSQTLDGRNLKFWEKFDNIAEMKIGESKNGREFMLHHVKWHFRFKSLPDAYSLTLSCNKENVAHERFHLSMRLTVTNFDPTEHICEFHPHRLNYELRFFNKPGLINCQNGSSVMFNFNLRLVTIIGTKSNTFSFHKSPENETPLTVGGLTFHFNKELLCQHSPGFRKLYRCRPNFEEELVNWDSNAFQNYLEVVFDKIEMNDDVVDFVVKIARGIPTPKVVYVCEHFLIHKSRFNINRKRKLASDFNLARLKAHIALAHRDGETAAVEVITLDDEPQIANHPPVEVIDID